MKEKIRIDGDFVNAYLIRNKFTAKEFSAHLGYSQSWWSLMKHNRNYVVSKETAQKMCDYFGFQWDDLVAGEHKKQTQEPSWDSEEGFDTGFAFQADQRGSDIQKFTQILINLDQRMQRIEQLLENLQWLKK